MMINDVWTGFADQVYVEVGTLSVIVAVNYL